MTKTGDDPVNHPSHYTQGGIECIDAIQASMTPEEFRGFLKGQVLKYTWRGNYKGNPTQDAKKAAWYNNRLIQVLEHDEGEATSQGTVGPAELARHGEKPRCVACLQEIGDETPPRSGRGQYHVHPPKGTG